MLSYKIVIVLAGYYLAPIPGNIQGYRPSLFT
jgi:hypothetical protein